MKCPTDHDVLQLSERHGIEIDYCPSCRGVWLDRGELDKVIDVATRELRGQAAFAGPEDPYLRQDIRGWNDAADHRQARHDDRRDDHRDDPKGRQPSKRRSLLGELFEFGG